MTMVKDCRSFKASLTLGRDFPARGSRVTSQIGIQRIYPLLSLAMQSEFQHYEHTGTVFGAITGKQFGNLPVFSPAEPLIASFGTFVVSLEQRLRSNVADSRALAAQRDTLLPRLVPGEVWVGGVIRWYGGIRRVMTPNIRMSRFSIAYIRAIAATGGYGVLETSSDEDLDSIGGKLVSLTGARPQIDFQAKATSQEALHYDGIRFSLPVKNYDDLRAETRTPRILIVLLMPPATEDWLTQGADELCLRRCAYWLSLEGRDAVPNSSRVTVTIPVANVFSEEQLDYLMDRAAAGESL